MTYDPREVRGTPHGAPLVPQFPLRMRDTEILTVVYRSDRAAIEAMVPAPLVLLGDLVLVHVYAMHDAEWFGVYGESAVQIPVQHEASGTTGAYSPLLVVEGDGPVAAGREIYGQPKKAGRIRLGAHGDLLVGTVRRNGITIIRATMPYKQVAGTADVRLGLLHRRHRRGSREARVLSDEHQSQGDPGRRRIRRRSERADSQDPR